MRSLQLAYIGASPDKEDFYDQYYYDFDFCGTSSRTGVLYYYEEGISEREQKVSDVDFRFADGAVGSHFGFCNGGYAGVGQK